MKTFRIIDDEQPNLWDELGEAVNAAANMAHMLACAAEERMGQDAEAIKEQQEAVVYGAYRVEELAKAARHAYYALLQQRYAQEERPLPALAVVH